MGKEHFLSYKMGLYSAVLWLSNRFSSENIHTFYLNTSTLKLYVLFTLLVNIFIRYIPPNHYAMLFAINKKQAKLNICFFYHVWHYEFIIFF